MSHIDELRNKVDEVTLEMIKLLKTRTDIAKEIGNIKKNLGLGITDQAREEQLRAKIISLCHDIGLDESIGTKFLNFLLTESVKIQSETKQTHLSVFLKAKALEEEGKKIIHMEVGEPDFSPPKIVKNALEEVYDKGFVKYGQAKGMPVFRTALAESVTKLYGTNTKPENIIVCPGARFAVYLAITTLLNAGDEIIVIEPAWPAYRECAQNSGIKVRSIKTTLESKWEPSVQQIADAINSNTKMIVLNYPNNPTGKILPPKLQDKIIEVVIKNDLYILSDEIYSQYTYNKEWKSILSYNYKKSIVTQSFSKSHSMTGFRIGFAITDSQIIDKMAKLQALCLTNVSEPMQYVALQALKADTSNNSINMKTRLNTVTQKAKAMKLDFVEPDGAMYLFVKLGNESFDATKFTNEALNFGLALAPGEAFGDYKNFIRISTGIEEKNLMEGMSLLKTVLDKK
ncbi:MAG: aminotransferase class I/II-fold pyridoxal phosphate-dependent enzyme [Nitrosopumilales archaeon]|nr:aminotransferase class I/II-fold pyridoxal phosphate-dependent enzyme [Nitrosopumilales archaeon]